MRRSLLLFLLLIPAILCFAQDDRSAGLFTEARQLPMVSQSIRVRILEGEARVELTQVFANDGENIAQADYRFHLPAEASVESFGFWNDGVFYPAKLAPLEEARRRHEAAARTGRATAILRREASIHSFSVYPVAAHSLRELSLSLVIPVVAERGRNEIRLPIDHFLGHAQLMSSVIVDLESREALKAFGVDGAKAEKKKLSGNQARMVFSAENPVQIWWASKRPPLLAAAEATELDAGSYALSLRLALNRTKLARSAPAEILLLVDASVSMRRRGRALETLIERLRSQSPAPVRIFGVGEEIFEVSAEKAFDCVREILSGKAGFSTSYFDLQAAAEEKGCERTDTRCIVLTDPQVLSLPPNRKLETLFFADADELAYFADKLGPESLVFQPEIDPTAALETLADEFVLPTLSLRSLSQDGRTLSPVGRTRLRAAQGGMIRAYFHSESLDDLELELDIDNTVFPKRIPIDLLDREDRLARALRRGYFRSRLDAWSMSYRKSRDPDLKRQIIAISLREGIPTDLTALHASAPRPTMARTASPAPLFRLLGLSLLLLAAILKGRFRCCPS